MQIPRSSRVVSTSAAVTLAITAFSVAPAHADGQGSHRDSLLGARLVGSMPAPASPTIGHITPGGLPWVNGPSRVRVSEHGRIQVDIVGLVIPPPLGAGVNPVASVVATVVCDRKVAGSSAPFALSPAGNGSTSGMVSVPRQCDDAAVLIQPAANLGVYIASTVGNGEGGADE
ncbi:hypothetical protein V3N99_13900 [Dermatophilaceae bacterium Soc4.6]